MSKEMLMFVDLQGTTITEMGVYPLIMLITKGFPIRRQ